MLLWPVPGLVGVVRVVCAVDIVANVLFHVGWTRVQVGMAILVVPLADVARDLDRYFGDGFEGRVEATLIQVALTNLP